MLYVTVSTRDLLHMDTKTLLLPRPQKSSNSETLVVVDGEGEGYLLSLLGQATEGPGGLGEADGGQAQVYSTVDRRISLYTTTTIPSLLRNSSTLAILACIRAFIFAKWTADTKQFDRIKGEQPVL